MTAPLAESLAGDLDGSFPAFVDAHGAMVLTLATRLTDTATGEDITQEVFLRAYRALSGYGRDRVLALDARAWLATITRNLVRNEYRRRQRRATVPLNRADGFAPDTSQATIDELHSEDRVNGLLAELSDPQREAVVLRHVIGLSMREVALAMACPEGTAKSHVSRGLSRLRDRLESTTPLGEREGR